MYKIIKINLGRSCPMGLVMNPIDVLILIHMYKLNEIIRDEDEDLK